MSAGLDLLDVWKSLRPNEQGFTYHSPRGLSRIDRIYASRSLSFQNINIERLAIGDHEPLFASLNFERVTQVRINDGLWKMNTCILSEERYAQTIANFIKNACLHPTRETDIGQWWEHVFKPGLKRETINYCKRRAWLQRNTREFFQECLSDVINADTFNPV